MDTNSTNRMPSRGITLSIVAILAVVSMWGLTSPSAQARITSMLAGPTAVATIDIDAVLQQLDERATLEEELKALGAELENDVNTMKASAEEKQGDLELFEPGSADFQRTQRELQLADAEWRLRAEFASRVIREQQTRLQRTLFNRILDASRDYAEREGWDIVLLDDSTEGLDPRMTAEQFSAFVATRGVVYRNDSVDITNAVATAMNNAFRNNVKP